MHRESPKKEKQGQELSSPTQHHKADDKGDGYRKETMR